MFRHALISPAGLRISTVKLMVDGVIESETASLHEPYCGCNGHYPTSPMKRKSKTKPKLSRSASLLNTEEALGHRGVTNFDRDALVRIVELLDREGFQVRACRLHQ